MYQVNILKKQKTKTNEYAKDYLLSSFLVMKFSHIGRNGWGKYPNFEQSQVLT